MISTRAAFASVVLSAALLAGCGTRYVSTRSADPVLIANAHSPAEMRAAIIRAMAARDFTPMQEEAGRIFARFDHKDDSLTVAIEYSPTQYVVRYVSSQGLDMKIGAAPGEVLVERRWADWVKGLRKSIDKELVAPAKQAAAAAARERQYQLMLEQQRTAQAQAQAQANAQAQAQANAQAAQPAPVTNQLVIQPPPFALPPIQPVNVQHSHQSSSQTLTCCINGAGYACPTQAAFQRCASLQPHECRADRRVSCR